MWLIRLPQLVTVNILSVVLVGSLVTACAPADAQEGSTSDASQSRAQQTVSVKSTADMDRMLAQWPAHTRAAAQDQTQKYGPPDDVTSDTVTWRGKGPWLWTRIDRMDTPHNFPAPHPDLMEQAVYFRVPADKVDDLNAFDGSVTVYRTRGFLAARCDTESANFLALNLAHDIITGAKTVSEARAYYAEAIAAFKAGRPDAYMTGLRFRPQTASAADPDRPA